MIRAFSSGVMESGSLMLPGFICSGATSRSNCLSSGTVLASASAFSASRFAASSLHAVRARSSAISSFTASYVRSPSCDASTIRR